MAQMDNFEKSMPDGNSWLLQLASIGSELENRTVKGIKVLKAQKGLLRCSYTVQVEACGKDEFWHAGAIATLVDAVGATAIYSASGQVKTSLDFGISFYSPVKCYEEVVVEATVTGGKGRLTSAVTEVRRKDNGELTAVGKQWFAEVALVPKFTKNKIQVVKRSKL